MNDGLGEEWTQSIPTGRMDPLHKDAHASMHESNCTTQSQAGWFLLKPTIPNLSHLPPATGRPATNTRQPCILNQKMIYIIFTCMCAHNTHVPIGAPVTAAKQLKPTQSPLKSIYRPKFSIHDFLQKLPKWLQKWSFHESLIFLAIPSNCQNTRNPTNKQMLSRCDD